MHVVLGSNMERAGQGTGWEVKQVRLLDHLSPSDVPWLRPSEMYNIYPALRSHKVRLMAVA